MTTKHDDKRNTKLTERHRGLLAPGETILSTVPAVAPETPQPNHFFTSGIGGMLGLFIGRAVDRPKARARAMTIRDHIGGPFSQFPESKRGYRIATTQLRVLVFDHRAKELVSEGPIAAMSVSSIDHGSEMSSMIFTDGHEHLAVTSVRGNPRQVERFVGTFPRPIGAAPRSAMASASPGASDTFEF